MKKLKCILLACVLVMSMGITAAAQTTETGDVYITDYDNLGELWEDIDAEKFEEMSDADKESLYNTSIEEVMSTPQDEESNMESRLVVMGYTLSGNSPSTGRSNASAYMKATATCPSLSAILLIYDANGKVIDRDTAVEYNAKEANASLNESGLTSGAVYTVYCQFHVNYPAGEEKSSDTATRSRNVTVK